MLDTNFPMEHHPCNQCPICHVFTLSNNHIFEWGHDIFAKEGWDVRAVVSMLPEASTLMYVADAALAKEITMSRARFPKPVELYKGLSFYGENIVASEGDQWKKYRKISAPAFSERNNRLVWDETTSVMHGLFDEVWKDSKSITVDHCLDISLSIALFTIGSAGFGRKISWKEDDIIPSGHNMSFKAAVQIISEDFLLPLIVPKWALGITKRTKAAGQALVEMRKYMTEMIHQRRHSEKVERNDLFSILLEENSQHLDDAALTDDELIGNVFLFLLAGHETTAHTLAYAFCLLALYPDEQEKLYQHIKSVLPDGRTPKYEDMNTLTSSLAVLHETLRLFPVATSFPKVSTEDTILTTHNLQGEPKTIAVPKGAYITISIVGIHYNPRYWPDPKAFKPERFLKSDWPRDAFIPFSSGSRACLGRRFAETEAVAVLTMLVSRYKITVKEEPQFANETFEQRKSRILASEQGLTLAPLRSPLVFTRR
ncbi:cytochrome P450 [Panaeolus papilionaceus]|nr:cytochrome P450 [Panaeolus papilionaceus]